MLQNNNIKTLLIFIKKKKKDAYKTGLLFKFLLQY